MKFTLDTSSLETFNKNRMVEISGLFDSGAIDTINREIDFFLAKEKVETQERAMALGHEWSQIAE